MTVWSKDKHVSFEVDEVSRDFSLEELADMIAIHARATYDSVHQLTEDDSIWIVFITFPRSPGFTVTDEHAKDMLDQYFTEEEEPECGGVVEFEPEEEDEG